MKKKKIKKEYASHHLTAVIVLLSCCCLLANERSASFVVKTAALSAGLALPQGSVEVIKNNYNNAFQQPDNEPDTAKSVVINDNTGSVPTASKGYQTPKDIVAMENDAKSLYSASTHDGVILEKQYDVSNATSSYKNITVRNTTPSHSINIETSLNQKAVLNITDKSVPTVLIFHTHTTESYELQDAGWYTSAYPTRSDDPKRNMVRVGDAVCEELEKQGIGFIHDTQIYDSNYTGAYDRSRETVTRILSENPTIQIVLDVHRDAIYQKDGTRVKPTVVVNNKKAAQIMIIAGCEDGKVSSFPSWEQNLTFALQLHEKAETMYPGLMRPILFSARKYNMDVVPCSVLLEMGSDSNTLAEAEYSGHLIGSAIAQYVNEHINSA